MWSELFCRGDDPPTTVRWSEPEARTASGVIVRPEQLQVTFPGGPEWRRLDVVIDDIGVQQRTNVTRSLDHLTLVPPACGRSVASRRSEPDDMMAAVLDRAPRPHRAPARRLTRSLARRQLHRGGHARVGRPRGAAVDVGHDRVGVVVQGLGRGARLGQLGPVSCEIEVSDSVSRASPPTGAICTLPTPLA